MIFPRFNKLKPRFPLNVAFPQTSHTPLGRHFRFSGTVTQHVLSYTLTTKTAVNQYGRPSPAKDLQKKMIGVRIFKLLSSQKSLFLKRYQFHVSYCTSQRCSSSTDFHSNVSLLTPQLISVERVKNRNLVSRRFASSHETPEQPKKQVESPLDASSHHHHTVTILQRLHDLEESFRVRGHSVLRWGLSALIVAGFVIYIFREPLRENVADEVADVASRSLGKATVKLIPA